MTGAILVCQVGYVVGVKVESPVVFKGPRYGTPPPVSFPYIPYTHSLIPPPFPGSLQGPTFSLAFFDNDFQHIVNHCIPLVESTNSAM